MGIIGDMMEGEREDGGGVCIEHYVDIAENKQSVR